MSEKVTGTVSPKKSVKGLLNAAKTVGGTRDYNDLDNKPSINTITLIGDKSFSDLGLQPMTNEMIEDILSQ